MSFDYQRPEYVEALDAWQLVRRCVAGAKEVKKHNCYLPMPDPCDQSEENIERYIQYKKRAMFLNVTGRTRVGLIGAVFRKTAEVQLPSPIEYLNENASGDGCSLEQLAKRSVGELLNTGRAGLLVDYPDNPMGESGNAPTSDLTNGKQAFIHFYPSSSIINWREEVINGVKKLTLVVLREEIQVPSDDGFELEIQCQYRALVIEDGIYHQRLYVEGQIAPIFDAVPRDGSGRTFDALPFSFIGSESNDASIDTSPLYDLAEVNILHYQDSATLQESAWIASQPTLFVTSKMSTEDWKEANPECLKLGSRRGYFLGEQGSATMLQAAESQLSRTLMQDKEDQMVKIGARIVQDSSGAETAEAVRIRYSSDNSVLGTISGNVSEAIKSCLMYAWQFMSQGNQDQNEVVYWLNQEFFDESMDSQMLLAQVQAWQQGIMSKSDLRTNMRQAGILESDRTDEDIDGDLADEPPIMSISDDGE